MMNSKSDIENTIEAAIPEYASFPDGTGSRADGWYLALADLFRLVESAVQRDDRDLVRRVYQFVDRMLESSPSEIDDAFHIEMLEPLYLNPSSAQTEFIIALLGPIAFKRTISQIDEVKNNNLQHRCIRSYRTGNLALILPRKRRMVLRRPDQIERQDKGRFVKVAFTQNVDRKHPELEERLEWMWCERMDNGGYRVDNIPFFIYGTSMNDLVQTAIVEIANQSSVAFQAIQRRAGHSTFRVRVGSEEALTEEDKHIIAYHISLLNDMACDFEFGQSELIAIDSPPKTSLDGVRMVLDSGVTEGIWEWETGDSRDNSA